MAFIPVRGASQPWKVLGLDQQVCVGKVSQETCDRDKPPQHWLVCLESAGRRGQLEKKEKVEWGGNETTKQQRQQI